MVNGFDDGHFPPCIWETMLIDTVIAGPLRSGCETGTTRYRNSANVCPTGHAQSSQPCLGCTLKLSSAQMWKQQAERSASVLRTLELTLGSGRAVRPWSSGREPLCALLLVECMGRGLKAKGSGMGA